MSVARTRALRDMGLTPWLRRCATSSKPPPEAQTAARCVAVHGEVSRASQPDPLPLREPQSEVTPIRGGERRFSDWTELEQAVSTCSRCALSEGRRQTVFGVGARHARWLLIGEAPGAEEDRRGEPFVGRAGKLLDAMLYVLGLEREDVFITNIVKCRPPGNRDPRPEEAAACRPYLDKQIEWVAPELILALGRVAAQQLLGVDSPVGRLRGRVHEGPGERPVVVTYHPAYLLRTPIAKRKVWEDLKLAWTTAAPREGT
ncbi:MAG: uracil-DNA glycosylase [Gammaproteobacteria bacterium]|nr:uracil-DNA glycosylase [Gammaproteobacteria bacterium]